MSSKTKKKAAPNLSLDTLIDQIWDHFDRDELAKVCEMDERDFAAHYGMARLPVPQPEPDDFFLFRSHGEGETGSKILAVAHLDTVAWANPFERRAQFLETEGGTVVYSRALDDRLGAYIILELLPKLGLNFDVLLTVGEENGRSTAAFFDPTDHDYNWMIEFDRGGSDVVMYQYEDSATADLVRDTGARVEEGIFSDISFLEQLGIKGFNWGVGYQDYHGPKAHAWLDDTFKMLAYFLRFHDTNQDRVLDHVPSVDSWWTRRDSSWSSRGSSGGYAANGDVLVCECEGDEEYPGGIPCEGKVDDTDYGVICDAHYAYLRDV